MSEAAARARAAQLDWAAVTTMSDVELDARLYPRPATDVERPLPDPATLDIELRKTGVTLRLLHHEYLEQNRDWRRDRGRAVRRGARRVELHLRGGDAVGANAAPD